MQSSSWKQQLTKQIHPKGHLVAVLNILIVSHESNIYKPLRYAEQWKSEHLQCMTTEKTRSAYEDHVIG